MAEKPQKSRLDIRLVELGLMPSREKARAVIMSGEVYVNGQKAEKAGESVLPDSAIEVRGNKLKYVSRGGLKLEKAIEEFGISLDGLICADIGASTGGFTDCMLQNGAVGVYAVDVGYGQLDWNLRNDPRVTVMEKTNARYLTRESLGGLCGFASVDVSFISLTKILPVFVGDDGILEDYGQALCLIKPQFECGKKYVGKKGVVKDRFVHEYVINKVIECGAQHGLFAHHLTYSPIKGPNGNIEYLIHLSKQSADFSKDIPQLVEEAHETL